MQNPRLVPEIAQRLSASSLETLSSGNDIAHCAFALCWSCHKSYSLVDDHNRPSRHKVLGMKEPGLALPICRMCDPISLCPSHVNCCILTCEGCNKGYCGDGAQHCNMDFPRIDFCWQCNRSTCINQPRWMQVLCEVAAGFTLNWCSDCGMASCSNCTANFTGSCTFCHKLAGFRVH